MSKVAPPNQPLEQHSEQQMLLAGYILGDLSSEEALSFDRLIKADRQFVEAELVQLQQSLETIYGEEIAPPDYLKNRTLLAVTPANAQDNTQANTQANAQAGSVFSNRLSSRKTEREIAAVSRRLSFPRWTALGGLGLATAGLIVAMGFQNYGLRRSLQALQSAPTEQPVTETLTFALAPAEGAPKGTQAGETTGKIAGEIKIVVDPIKLTGFVETKNLPPLKADKVYALWAVVAEDAPVTKDSQNAILTAVLPVTVAGSETQQIAIPSVFRDRALIKAVAVTVEDAAAPQRHQASPLFIQKL